MALALLDLKYGRGDHLEHKLFMHKAPVGTFEQKHTQSSFDSCNRVRNPHCLHPLGRFSDVVDRNETNRGLPYERGIRGNYHRSHTPITHARRLSGRRRVPMLTTVVSGRLSARKQKAF